MDTSDSGSTCLSVRGFIRASGNNNLDITGALIDHVLGLDESGLLVSFVGSVVELGAGVYGGGGGSSIRNSAGNPTPRCTEEEFNVTAGDVYKLVDTVGIVTPGIVVMETPGGYFLYGGGGGGRGCALMGLG